MAKTSRPPSQTRSEVIGCGYIHKLGQVPEQVCKNRDLGFYALVYLIDGGGYYADEYTAERPVRAGDVLVLFPGLRHSYYPGDQPTWTEIWLTFRGGLFAQLEREGLIERSRPVVHPGLDQALMAGFDRVHAEVARDDWRQGPGLVAGTHQLITEVLRLDQAGQPQAELASRACEVLATALERPLELGSAARELGMGYEAFRKFFVRAVGKPPAQWRQLKRIERARRLLIDSEMPLAAIAEELGYCDQYFFNRQFKRVTGISPARFRRDFARSPAADTDNSQRPRPG